MLLLAESLLFSSLIFVRRSAIFIRCYWDSFDGPLGKYSSTTWNYWSRPKISTAVLRTNTALMDPHSDSNSCRFNSCMHANIMVFGLTVSVAAKTVMGDRLHAPKWFPRTFLSDSILQFSFIFCSKYNYVGFILGSALNSQKMCRPICLIQNYYFSLQFLLSTCFHRWSDTDFFYWSLRPTKLH